VKQVANWLVHAETAKRTVAPEHYSDPARAAGRRSARSRRV